MDKEYNQWYWKIYRWFKWDFKHSPRRFVSGIKNLWKWFPIIFKDRDWDHYYIYEVLKFKINNTADYIENNNRHIGCREEVRYMRICVKLIDMVQSGFYSDEMHSYWETKMRTEPTEDGLYSVEFDDIKNDLSAYISKYPNDKRRALKSKFNNIDSDKSLAIVMSHIRTERANKILFLILNQRMQGWWD